MKRILLGDPSEKLVATVELILKHWGYRVMASSNPVQVARFLQEVPPDMLILGSGLLADPSGELRRVVAERLGERPLPLLVMGSEASPSELLPPHDTLGVPLDIFRLFTLIQHHLEPTPRRNLRMKLQLPGMFFNGATPCMAEVLSLSAHGLFIKTGCRVDNLERLAVIFPLIGMKTEVEVAGRVLYRVQPAPENNYLQGVGIEFTDLTPETVHIIQDFLESRVLDELTASYDGARQFDLSQLQVHSHRDLTLRSATPPQD